MRSRPKWQVDLSKPRHRLERRHRFGRRLAACDPRWRARTQTRATTLARELANKLAARLASLGARNEPIVCGRARARSRPANWAGRPPAGRANWRVWRPRAGADVPANAFSIEAARPFRKSGQNNSSAQFGAARARTKNSLAPARPPHCCATPWRPAGDNLADQLAAREPAAARPGRHLGARPSLAE